MENKLTLLEALDRMEALARDLKQLGVPADAIPGVMERIEEYTELKEGLDAARADQFHWDAYEMLAAVQSASNKAVKALTLSLRQFAQHVASHTLHLTEQYGGDLSAIVDRIPPMSDQGGGTEEDQA